MHDHFERLESSAEDCRISWPNLLSVPAAASTNVTGESLIMLVTSWSVGNPSLTRWGGSS